MVLEKMLKQKQEEVFSFKEGLSDILNVVKEINLNNIEGQQSTIAEDLSSNVSHSTSNKDEVDANVIISIVFDIQRFYQAQQSELMHTIQMEKLKLEGLESLQMDLEILNEEKQITDQEI